MTCALPRLLISLLLLASMAGASGEEIAIVVNPDNPVDSISRRQLINLYMGRHQEFPNGRQAIPLDHAPDSAIRRLFYKALTGKTVAQVNAYWARLLFSGRASPPQTVDSSQKILEIINHDPKAIGYIYSSQIVSSVKVIARVE